MILTAVPYCGLCNRLRCLASTTRIAKETNREFQFCWRILPECGGSFNDLFKNQIPQVDEEYIATQPVNRLYSDRIAFDGDGVQLLGNQIARHDSGQHVLIQSCGYVAFEDEKMNNWFPPPPKDFLTEMALWYQALQPVNVVADAVESKATKFNSSTIGLHIRRTDHTEAITRSTDTHFLEAINNEINRNINANFFLATDCPKTEAAFVARFPHRIHVQQKTNWLNPNDRRSTVQGMQEALVDLLLLSRISRILVSARSTFGLDAKLFSNIPGEANVIGSED